LSLDFGDPTRRPPLVHGEEQVFFRLEIRVDSAFGVAGFTSDLIY
jgi:hypothetical protein